jgi:hypothetical protein
LLGDVMVSAILTICIFAVMFLSTIVIRQRARIKTLEEERMENRKDLAQYAYLNKSGEYELETKNGAITGLKEIIKYLEENN